MNDTSLPRPRIHHGRGVAVLVGAMMVATPFASAHAAQGGEATHQAEVEPLDLHEVVTVQHRRVLDGIELLLARALRRSFELRAAFRDGISPELGFDRLVADGDETWGTQLEENEPAARGRRHEVDVVTDTNDPLAGLL